MTFDPAAFLASLAKPMKVQELVARGDLVDATLAARWHGFQANAYLTLGAWEAVVGPRSPGKRRLVTPQERAREGKRLHQVWELASKQMSRYASLPAKHLPACIPLHVPLANSPTLQRLEIRVATEGHEPYLTIRLTGE